jgi:hypothetical protein
VFSEKQRTCLIYITTILNDNNNNDEDDDDERTTPKPAVLHKFSDFF